MRYAAAMVALIAAFLAASCYCSVEFRTGRPPEDEEDIDKDIRAFVDEAVVSIFGSQSYDALMSRAAPELASIEGAEKVFDDVLAEVGPLKSHEIVDVRVMEGALPETGDRVPIATYAIEAVFETGPGQLELQVTKRDGELQILSWIIRSDVLLP